VPPPAPASNRTPLLLGLALVVVLLLCGAGLALVAVLGVFTTTRASFAATPTSVALVFPTFPPAPTPDQSGAPPRMPLADFKQLYDDLDHRPLIIDVRAAETYDAGHIAGAISFPESDVDARVTELPKDKMIIAYCQ
jgi:hypothetical protein